MSELRLPDWTEPGQLGELEVLRRRLVRLALDVHDGPMQTLTAAGFGLRDLEHTVAQLPVADDDAQQISGRIASIVDELGATEKTLRSLISTLEQGTPEIEPLQTIVDEELDRFERRSAASVDASYEPAFLPDTHSQAIALRSVVREALNNVAKHSQATRVRVHIETSPSEILLEVHDNGIGFDSDAVPAGRIGLTSMHQRVNLLGGVVEVSSRPGGPTVVTALFRRWRRPTAV